MKSLAVAFCLQTCDKLYNLIYSVTSDNKVRLMQDLETRLPQCLGVAFSKLTLKEFYLLLHILA
jgi:hypothetical protein